VGVFGWGGGGGGVVGPNPVLVGGGCFWGLVGQDNPFGECGGTPPPPPPKVGSTVLGCVVGGVLFWVLGWGSPKWWGGLWGGGVFWGVLGWIVRKNIVLVG